MNEMRIASFRFDITPPFGHSLCGGWIQAVLQVDDALEAIGFVLSGAGNPIVVCALDWLSLLNRGYGQWQRVLADAAGTTPDRVAIQCVHQHNAPFVCLESQALVEQEEDLPHIVQPEFFDDCLQRGRGAVEEAVTRSKTVTHVAHSQSIVNQVASNRRVARDQQGRVVAERSSFCRDAWLRDLPEGLIDPWLKTVAFYNGSQRIVVSNYFATHPHSYYGDGRVSSDFVGLARKRRQNEEPDCQHIYFTGCAGNISAGKYNDGSNASRQTLTNHLYDAMLRSDQNLQPVPIEHVDWRVDSILPSPHPALVRPSVVEQLTNRYYPDVTRNRAAFQLAWLNRIERGEPLPLSALRINDIAMLHLPGECFVEYQLRAQTWWPSGFVATAAYGDGGPWYIPVREEYDKGGYELTSAYCDSSIDEQLSSAIRGLLA